MISFFMWWSFGFLLSIVALSALLDRPLSGKKDVIACTLLGIFGMFWIFPAIIWWAMKLLERK